MLAMRSGGTMKTHISQARLVFCVAILFMLVSTYGFGQAVYGSIYGTVTDSSGAAVPNAQIHVTSVQQGTRVDATTNDTGLYNIGHLIPGDYNVQSEAAGFKSEQAKNIKVSADTSNK